MPTWMTKATELLSFDNVMRLHILIPYICETRHIDAYTQLATIYQAICPNPLLQNIRLILDISNNNLEVNLFVENNTQLSYLTVLILLKRLLLAVHLKYLFTASVYIVTNDYVVQW